MLSLKDQVRILYKSGQSSLGLSGMRAPWRKSERILLAQLGRTRAEFLNLRFTNTEPGAVGTGRQLITNSCKYGRISILGSPGRYRSRLCICAALVER